MDYPYKHPWADQHDCLPYQPFLSPSSLKFGKREVGRYPPVIGCKNPLYVPFKKKTTKYAPSDTRGHYWKTKGVVVCPDTGCL